MRLWHTRRAFVYQSAALEGLDLSSHGNVSFMFSMFDKPAEDRLIHARMAFRQDHAINSFPSSGREYCGSVKVRSDEEL
jgi:hypothetical protein